MISRGSCRETLIFDSGPLSHFARENWLGVLKAVVGDREAIIPDAVMRELQIGAQRDSRIQAVLDADWIERRVLDAPAEISAFAKYSKRLGWTILTNLAEAQRPLELTHPAWSDLADPRRWADWRKEANAFATSGYVIPYFREMKIHEDDLRSSGRRRVACYRLRER